MKNSTYLVRTSFDFMYVEANSPIDALKKYKDDRADYIKRISHTAGVSGTYSAGMLNLKERMVTACAMQVNHPIVSFENRNVLIDNKIVGKIEEYNKAGCKAKVVISTEIDGKVITREQISENFVTIKEKALDILIALDLMNK